MTYGICVFIIYALVLNTVCFFAKRSSTGDEYVIGGRSFRSLYIAFGLFTLLGGGTFVANASLGFELGIYGFSLFLGNGLGFVFLALYADRLRAQYDLYKPVSLPDFFHAKFGKIAGWVSFFVSFIAFFGLLVMQFVAAGDLLFPILHLPFSAIVWATAATALSYLLISGFRAVIGTDLLQGIIMLILIPLLTVKSKPPNIDYGHWFPKDVSSVAIIGILFAGFISALASADIWQRAFAAKDISSARVGFLLGAAVITGLGFVLVLLGIFAASAGAPDADQAFGYLMYKDLSPITATLVSMMILSVIVSTADTEIFLLGGMAARQLQRARGMSEQQISVNVNLLSSRLWVAITAILAAFCATFSKDLITLYGWLLSLSLVLGPMALAAIVMNVSPYFAAGVLFINILIFLIAAYTGYVSVDSSYVVALPSTVLVLGFAISQSLRTRMSR